MIINSANPSLSEIDYPAWCQDDKVPVTTSELREIFDDLTERFGFQKSSKENMYHHLMAQLDSRASRSTAYTALLSLHVSYIGGEHSNFRRWYFAAQLDLDDEIGFQNMKLTGDSRKRNFKLAKKRGTSIKEQLKDWKQKEIEFENSYPKISLSKDDLENGDNLKIADYKWKSNMKRLSPKQMVRQIALYLLCWGEANQVRFAPECLCFIFKCALDYDANLTATNSKQTLPEYTYLDDIITPLYTFLKNQLYKSNSKNEWIKRETDHRDIIGYDDINQLFWYPEGIESIILNDSQRLVDIPQVRRFLHLKDVVWSKVFYKTYKEKRGWMHCFTNFNRFWLIHFTPFWIFTSFNSPTLYTKDYIQLLNNQPTYQVRLCVMAFGGTITCLIQIFATIFEWCVVPRRWPGAQHLSTRMAGLIFCLLINFCPSIYIFGLFDLNTHSKSAFIVAIIQFIISILTTLLFSIRPLGGFFGSYLNKDVKKRRYISSQTFTASFAKLTGRSKWFSIGLWIFVFLAKYLESYFFLTLSLRDPIRVLSTMDLSRCGGDLVFGKSLCLWQAQITLVLMLLCDLCLFFLDTYLWYIICNCIFSLVLSLSLGTSIFTPWKNIYSRLPKRIYSKIISTVEMNAKFKSKLLVSQIWNSIIISMYREHLLSIEHIQKLLYQQMDSTIIDSKTLRSPTFFVAQDDSTYKSMEFFPKNSEAKRRISFFAQSLSTPISEPIPVECMPSFTVIVPHYSEKIILGLKEIIKEESATSRMTILEYLKHLHPAEWSYFVRDTKLLMIENDAKLKTNETNNNIEITNYNIENDEINNSSFFEKTEFGDTAKLVQDKINELPLDLFGFKSSDTSYTLRTRLWASLRMQTLYRTISGFMNYSKAIKLLQRIENPSVLEYFGDDGEALENNLENVANRKFRMLVAMQRYVNFSPDEILDTEILLRSFPNIYISYLDIERDTTSNVSIYYSCLTNGFAEIDEVTGLRKPIFKIRLSGNPILGDGKSDNQNSAIIFYRGEYIQVVDANQDNYLEECLKIRSLLAEFDELDLESSIPYIPGIQYDEQPAPIAILGAREYIFSENIGVLGDIAAGKEQTFGTLFARTLAEIDGKLHYGHPDFINAIFMTTRGGLSKAQKGLHLNEDIYAGMNALCRGGRIKHSDYYQCGKGRDLGFSSILNFTTKIGAGMGEQLLSREYYYLGTQLPMDRFLTFFYAHPGFHLNNLFISMSLHLFFLLLLNLGSLGHETIHCCKIKHSVLTDIQRPLGCYNIEPALHWVSIFVLSIFIVFFIAFAPLLIQELLEKGVIKALLRFLHHLFSMAPLFEVFVCQIYSNSLLTDLTFGGAKYISTGRGFAITRVNFSTLYARFVSTSIYSGLQIFLMLLFATASIWHPALLWFWLTVISLCFAPFIFNPHQFSFGEFFIDYRDYIYWLLSGNGSYKKNSWSSLVKAGRARFTGYKKILITDLSENDKEDNKRANFWNILFPELLIPLFVFICDFFSYMFINSQTGVRNASPTNSLARLILVSLLPILLNMVILLILFFVSFVCGPIVLCCNINTGTTIAFIAHASSVVFYIISFELMWVLESWVFTRTLILLITSINLQLLLFRMVTLFCLTREFKSDKSHQAWWSGRWYRTGLGWNIVLQPMREYVVKVMESSYFSADFFLGHFLMYFQTPLLFIPFIDYWHSIILFWLKPRHVIWGKKFRTKKQISLRSTLIRKYFIIYATILVTMLALLLIPFLADRYVSDLEQYLVDTPLEMLVQPNKQSNNDTGPNAPSYILRTTPKLIPFKTVG